MRITALKVQVKNQERVSIFVDEVYSFSLGISDILNEKLKIGLELDEARVKQLKKKSADGKVRMRALEWVVTRPHSERELRDYLRRKKIEQPLVESIVSDFYKKKYLDDSRFASSFAEQRKRQLKSDRSIKAQLRSKGVSSEVIDQYFDEQDDTQKERIKELVEKKQKSTRYQDKQKLLAYLSRQGYSYDLIRDVMQEELGD